MVSSKAVAGDRPATSESTADGGSAGGPGQDVEVSVRQVVKKFGAVRALDGPSVDIGAGEIVSLLGPSGCGKTTMLRCLSGLETVTGGEITIGGKLVSARDLCVPAHKRGVGLVFQSYAIWPHLNVRRNVAYGLQVLKLSKAEIKKRCTEILDLVGLAGFENRLPAQLSGGQQQRVALARSLVVRPRVLLLDEPLSNLDATLRDRMRRELRTLLKEVGITSIYVTHDQREAFGLSDRIVLMRDGRILQSGAAEDLYEAPVNPFVATFLGGANLIPVTSVTRSGELAVAAAEQLGAVTGRLRDDDTADAELTAMFRPEKVRVGRAAPGVGANVWTGTVLRHSYEGPFTELLVALGPHRVRAIGPGLPAIIGDEVTVTVAPEDVMFLPAEIEWSNND